MRFHILGIQNSETSKKNIAEYKLLTFCTIMKKRGHEIIYYGLENSSIDASEYVFIQSQSKNSNVLNLDENIIKEIEKRKRLGDFLLAFGGVLHKNICDSHSDMIVVEPSIGYTCGHFAPYKIWDSYSIYHACLGVDKINNCFCNEKEYENDIVIPMFLDPDQFEYSAKKDEYFLFTGEEEHGLLEAIEMTRQLRKKLIVINENVSRNTKVPSHVEFVDTNTQTRKRLLSRAKAVICFSKFIDSLCIIHIEALMSGTPVISSDWGIFPESILHGINGFRCRTVEQLVKAGETIDSIDPENCRSFALSRYSYETVANQYETYFKNILKKRNIHDPFTFTYLSPCPVSLVDEIRKQYDNCNLINGTIGTQGEVNSSRRAKIYWIPKTDKISLILLNAILEENALRYGFNLSGTAENIQYTVYTSEEEGHYDWHIDAMKSHKRKLSAVLQLSDPSEYEGGELQIQNGEIYTVNKSKGTCVVFPSWMTHRVTQVTKGIRRTLVIWLEGPPFV
jgi:predicted 2-oxoglutarate/Fe(II)-dependent dioxygenase YbiX/glycosyltransferase involved in cell wall biosynthesis